MKRATGRYEEAERALSNRTAIEIAREGVGEAHPEFGDNLLKLANLLVLKRHFSWAEALYVRHFLIIENTLPNNHPYISIASTNLASLLEQIGKYHEAGEYRAKASDIRRRRGDEGRG